MRKVQVPAELDGLTALALAEAMAGHWQKRPGEYDTEKVKRIWRRMMEAVAAPDRPAA